MTQIAEGFILREKVAALQEKILAKHPTMPTLLREIHTAILQNPEQVVLMTEEEQHVVFSGLEVQVGVKLLESVVGKGSGAKSALSRVKQLGLDAF
jgi:hypothetical protein